MITPNRPRIRSCDTVVVAAAASASGRTLFGKNSDRHPNEAQYLTVVPAAEHASDAHAGSIPAPGAESGAASEVACTYVSVPQADRTARLIGSRPWWMWGFEHGINEHGVAIGNEALWSKLPPRTDPGLLGMDLLRLTLERSRTADEGLEVLTGLVEQYGQSGPTNPVIEETYDNGFVIADPQTAWLVQTAGHHWVAQRVTDAAAMSNVYSIGADYDLISEHAIDEAVTRGWYDPSAGEPFDFARAFGDEQLADLDGCARRYERSSELLAGLLASAGSLTLHDVHDVLRDLGEGAPASLRPGPRSEGAICMYAQDPEGSETAASLIAELDAEPTRCRVGVSAAAPRHAGLIPMWVDLDDLGILAQPAGSGADTAPDPDLWWATERLQRRIEAAYPALAPIADAVFGRVNRRFFTESADLVGATPQLRSAAVQEGERRHRVAVEELDHLFDALGPLIVEPGDADLRGDHLERLDALIEPTTADRAEAARRRVLGHL